MLRKRFLVAAALAAGSCLGLAGGATTAPAMSAESSAWGPVIGPCSDQTNLQKELIGGGVGPFFGVACNDTSQAMYPWGPDCMVYTEMHGHRTCKEYPLPDID